MRLPDGIEGSVVDGALESLRTWAVSTEESTENLSRRRGGRR